MTDVEVSQICKALSDLNRLKIVKILTAGEKCACELLETLNIDHSTLSHHVKVLAACDLIHTRKESKWIYYTLNCKTFAAYRKFIGSLECRVKNETSNKCCK